VWGYVVGKEVKSKVKEMKKIINWNKRRLLRKPRKGRKIVE